MFRCYIVPKCKHYDTSLTNLQTYYLYVVLVRCATVLYEGNELLVDTLFGTCLTMRIGTCLTWVLHKFRRIQSLINHIKVTVVMWVFELSWKENEEVQRA